LFQNHEIYQREIIKTKMVFRKTTLNTKF